MDRYLQLARPWPDDPDPDADRVFLTRQRRPFSRYTLGRVLDRLAARTGLANIHPHRFRHTFGVTYLRAGGDVLALQRILGHTTLVMVNHYLHLASSDVVIRHQAHSPLDRLPNERTFRRAARAGRPSWSMRNRSRTQRRWRSGSCWTGQARWTGRAWRRRGWRRPRCTWRARSWTSGTRWSRLRARPRCSARMTRRGTGAGAAGRAAGRHRQPRRGVVPTPARADDRPAGAGAGGGGDP